MFALLIIGGINTVISLVYYVRVVKIMVIDSPAQDGDAAKPIAWSFPVGSVVYASVLALAVFVLGILWDPLAVYTAQGMQRFTEAQKPARLSPGASPRRSGSDPRGPSTARERPLARLRRKSSASGTYSDTKRHFAWQVSAYGKIVSRAAKLLHLVAHPCWALLVFRSSLHWKSDRLFLFV
jgi:hypothetical protein